MLKALCSRDTTLAELFGNPGIDRVNNVCCSHSKSECLPIVIHSSCQPLENKFSVD
jgi:hypothetical protein